jgi:hypothetical protein
MNRKERIPVLVVSGILILYMLLMVARDSSRLPYIIFAISPLLIIWLAYNVIRHGEYKGKELEEGEEWGYTDKNKNDLGMF